MKQVLVVMVAVLLGACGYNPDYHITAENRSAFPVTFSISNGYGEETLAPGEKKAITLEGEKDSSVNYYTPDKKASCSYALSLRTLTFHDRISYKIQIINYTGKAGTLAEAGGYMDIVDFTSAQVQTSITQLVYSWEPNFTVLLDDSSTPDLIHILEADTFKVVIGNTP
jgi:hypothetical protein